MAGETAPTHPGAILQTEFVEPLSLTAYKVVKDLGVPSRRIGEIVGGNRAIPTDTVLCLGVYIGLPVQFWPNSQNEHDLRRAA